MREKALGRLWLPGLLLFGALLRLGYGWSHPPQVKGEPLSDPDGYIGLACSVADSWTLYEDGRASAHREPAYPVFLGLIFKVFGKCYGALLTSNALFGVLALYWLYRVGERLFGESAALLATAIGVLYPPFIFYAAQPFRETAMLAVSGLAVWSVLEARRRAAEGSGRAGLLAYAGAGAVHALAGLTNTTFLPFALLVPVVTVALERGRRTAIACAGCYLVVFLLIYSVWPLRNHRTFQTWILGSTAGAGSTFYMYLGIPQETGGTPEQEAMTAQDPVLREGGRISGVIRREGFFWKAGLRWVCRHPGRYARLVAWRFFVDTWRLMPRARAYAHSYVLLKWVSLLTDGWIIPLGLLGMLWVRCRPFESLWVYLLVFSVEFTYALVFTMLRYRISLMPWIILFAAAMLRRAWEYRQSVFA